jgi:hypothetical protein
MLKLELRMQIYCTNLSHWQVQSVIKKPKSIHRCRDQGSGDSYSSRVVTGSIVISEDDLVPEVSILHSYLKQQ